MDSSEPVFLKCSCAHCGGHLEFERAYLGLRVPCPHCGKETALTLSVSASPIQLSSVPEGPSTPPPPAESSPPAPGSTHHTGPVPAHGPDWPRYRKGEEIRCGDRARYKGVAAKVVFVSDGDHCEYVPGYGQHRGQDAGVVICDDDGDVTPLRGENLDLELIHRRR